MTPEDFAALGARLFLVQRLYWPLRAVAAMPDRDVLAIAAVVGGAR